MGLLTNIDLAITISIIYIIFNSNNGTKLIRQITNKLKIPNNNIVINSIIFGILYYILIGIIHPFYQKFRKQGFKVGGQITDDKLEELNERINELEEATILLSFPEEFNSNENKNEVISVKKNLIKNYKKNDGNKLLDIDNNIIYNDLIYTENTNNNDNTDSYFIPKTINTLIERTNQLLGREPEIMGTYKSGTEIMNELIKSGKIEEEVADNIYEDKTKNNDKRSEYFEYSLNNYKNQITKDIPFTNVCWCDKELNEISSDLLCACGEDSPITTDGDGGCCNLGLRCAEYCFNSDGGINCDEKSDGEYIYCNNLSYNVLREMFYEERPNTVEEACWCDVDKTSTNYIYDICACGADDTNCCGNYGNCEDYCFNNDKWTKENLGEFVKIIDSAVFLPPITYNNYISDPSIILNFKNQEQEPLLDAGGNENEQYGFLEFKSFMPDKHSNPDKITWVSMDQFGLQNGDDYRGCYVTTNPPLHFSDGEIGLELYGWATGWNGRPPLKFNITYKRLNGDLLYSTFYFYSFIEDDEYTIERPGIFSYMSPLDVYEKNGPVNIGNAFTEDNIENIPTFYDIMYSSEEGDDKVDERIHNLIGGVGRWGILKNQIIYDEKGIKEIEIDPNDIESIISSVPVSVPDNDVIFDTSLSVPANYNNNNNNNTNNNNTNNNNTNNMILNNIDNNQP